uniref:Uncharacterized protein n=1 Tax=Lynx canadensis TaxID=61383 RepID=A0A667I825_LYNCA
MRSRRRFSTSGFSICDRQERESWPTGPRLSAAAPALGSRRRVGPAPTPSPRPQRVPRARPIGSLSAPPPKAPRVNFCSSPPLSPGSSAFSCLVLPPPLFSLRLRLVQCLCLSGELWGGGPLCAQTRGHVAARCRPLSRRP